MYYAINPITYVVNIPKHFSKTFEISLGLGNGGKLKGKSKAVE